MPEPTDLNDISFLGRLSEMLSLRIEEQTRELFVASGIVIPVRSCSFLTALGQVDEASAAQLARTLGHSHQLVMQKAPALLRLGLIVARADPTDARRKLFRVTEKGQEQLVALEAYSIRISAIYRQLFDEVGDVHRIIVDTLSALEERPLSQRADN